MPRGLNSMPKPVTILNKTGGRGGGAAGTSASRRGAARRNACLRSKSKVSHHLNNLTKLPKRGYTVEPLQVDTLRPLVDLSYWSTFLEVRRDCAAAFATLSMNPANLETLSEAGVLGAVLALVGVGGGKVDQQVQRDAATALSYLVSLDDIKTRLLQAPDGLRSLFFMAKSQHVSVACKSIFSPSL